MSTTTPNTPFPTTSSSPSTAINSGAIGEVVDKADAAIEKGAAAGHDVLNRVVKGAHQTIDRLAETAGPAVQRVQDGVSAASDVLSRRAQDAREMGDEWAESLRSTVRDNPLTAIITALAVGVLIARLSR